MAGSGLVTSLGRTGRAFPQSPEPLDRYGGYRNLSVKDGGTGFFRVGQIGSRWVLVTPEGHAFWLRAVYGVNTFDGGAAYAEAVKKKYNSPGGVPWPLFVRQAARRLKTWGFNAIGEYSSGYALPIPSYNRRDFNPEQLPFISLINPSYWAKRWARVKNIQYGVDPEVTPGLWRVEGFPDVFDPAYAAALPGFAARKNIFTTVPLATSPWHIGTTTDDGDDLFGFGPVTTHNNLGWISAATAPTQARNDKRSKGNPTPPTSYTDKKVYTKYAFRDFLRTRYKSLEALNSAWGSRYATWDSDGEWPRGKGVLDESGRSPWLGRDFRQLKDSAPKVREDLNDFVGVLADHYYKIVSGALREALPKHLVIGPVNANGHPQILEAAGRHCDVVQIGGSLNVEDFRRVHALVRKPMFIWTTYMSQKHSALGSRKGWPGLDFATQEERGQAYASFLQKILAFRADDGTHPIIGIDWWAWTDKVAGGESNNFGLVSNLDNAYDGREAVVAAGTDPWGYPTGGEKANYGDFLSHVTRANGLVADALRAELSQRGDTGSAPSRR